jgi:hypothetical protein
MSSDGLNVIRGHIQWIIAQKDSSILLVLQLSTNTLNLIILVGRSDSIAILILIWSMGRQNFVSLRWLWIARVCPFILFISDHFLNISKSYNLLIVHHVLKMCGPRQAGLPIHILIIEIWLLFIIILLLLVFAGRGEKYLLERILCVTSCCHISLIIVSHWLCWKVVLVGKSLLLSFFISWVNRSIIVASYFWIFFLMIRHHNCLILVSVSHWFMKITDQLILLSFQVSLPLGLIRLLSILNYILIFDLRFSLGPVMMSITWINGRWFLGPILSQSNE